MKGYGFVKCEFDLRSRALTKSCHLILLALTQEIETDPNLNMPLAKLIRFPFEVYFTFHVLWGNSSPSEEGRRDSVTCSKRCLPLRQLWFWFQTVVSFLKFQHLQDGMGCVVDGEYLPLETFKQALDHCLPGGRGGTLDG